MVLLVSALALAKPSWVNSTNTKNQLTVYNNGIVKRGKTDVRVLANNNQEPITRSVIVSYILPSDFPRKVVTMMTATKRKISPGVT